jgi:hypothetical protein
MATEELIELEIEVLAKDTTEEDMDKMARNYRERMLNQPISYRMDLPQKAAKVTR